MQRAALALLPLLVVTGLSCAKTDPGTDPERLTSVTWVLDAASMSSLVPDPPAGLRADIRFDGQQVSGTSGCNVFGGTYEAGDDGSISFAAMSMTEMACDEPRMALEAAYLDALGAVSGFQVTDNGLLLTGGTVALTFVEDTLSPSPA